MAMGVSAVALALAMISTRPPFRLVVELVVLVLVPWGIVCMGVVFRGSVSVPHGDGDRAGNRFSLGTVVRVMRVCRRLCANVDGPPALRSP